MSIAAHAARLNLQLTLDLVTGIEPAPQPTYGEWPTLDALASAASANQCVREFIEDEVPTWTEERVRRDPPFYLVYEHGEVVGNVSDLMIMIRHAEKRHGLGRRLGVRALRPDDQVLAYTIGLRWGPTHPRRFRYEQRMALKTLLARGDRKAVWWAMRRTQRNFVKWAETRPGLEQRIADRTGLSLTAFWRTVRCRVPGANSSVARSSPATPNR